MERVVFRLNNDHLILVQIVGIYETVKEIFVDRGDVDHFREDEWEGGIACYDEYGFFVEMHYKNKDMKYHELS